MNIFLKINRALKAKTTKLFTLLLAIVASIGTMFAGTPVPIGDLYYDWDPSTRNATVVKNANYAKSSITIPSSFTYYDVTFRVTSIADSAFYNSYNLTSISIPSSITSIGKGVFKKCDKLTSVTWNVSSIDGSLSALFVDSKDKITTFVFGNTVTIIPRGICNGMNKLTSITIPNSVTSIGGSAFEGCSGLTSVTIPNSVTGLGGWAFKDCTALESITISKSVINFGAYPFSGCTNLKSVVWNAKNLVSSSYNPDFGSQVTSFIFGNEVETIPNGICSGMDKLTSITIPNSVTSIGSSAFNGCTGLKSVVWNARNCSNSGGFGSQVTSFTFGDAVETIPGSCCSGMNKLTSITIPNSVTSIGGSAFNGCTGLKSVTIGNSVTSIGNNAFDGCTGLTSVTIGNSVTSIAWSAFNGCSNITSVVWNVKNGPSYNFGSQVTSFTFGDEVETIPRSCCEGMDKLTSIVIPNSVTSIGQGAFYGCRNITSVVWNVKNGPSYNFGSQVTSFTFGDEVETIPGSCCADMNKLTSITIPNSVTSIGERAFNNCTGLTSVTIPNSVTSIGDEAFEDCTGLTSVTIGNSVTSIGDYAFEGCTGLTSVTIGNSVTSIGFRAFEGCSSLVSVTIPNSVTSIGDSAFWGCSGLTSVTIGNSVTSIGQGAFYGCSGLTSVTIPNSVISMGGYSFQGCTGLTSVVWDARNCSSSGGFDSQVTSFTFGDVVETIPGFCCSGMNKLTSITIPNSVTSIGKYAFNGCTGLTSVTFESSIPPTMDKNGSFDASFAASIYVPCGALETYTTSWPMYASFMTYLPLDYSITGAVNVKEMGIVHIPSYSCVDTIITATPNYGYHFLQWSDGNTDNPRTIELTQDTTFTAEFAKNSYAVSTISANPEWGTTAGDNSALYLDEVEISAMPNYGYHFVRWNDNNTSNPRTVSVTEDKTYTATFAKNVYTITKNAQHGSISSNNSAEYLDFVTLIAIPDYGYHFTQWSDGVTDNPRIFQITKDTTFTAEFMVDRSGTCGDNFALTWSYNPSIKTIVIDGNGSLNSNYTFGVEAPNNMEKLVIVEGVTSIGASAFANQSTLQEVSIPTTVKTVGEQAFYNCTGLLHIYNYRERPSVAYSNTFDGIDKFDCTLHVLSASINMYKAATGWRDFYYTETIDATETTIITQTVTVEAGANTATFTWPTENEADSYVIEITENGTVFCTLIFNANGQLTGIAFAPSRDGQAHTPQAILTTNGLQFTVSGLNSATQYGYSVIAKDSSDATIAAYSGNFTTTGEGVATGIEEISSSLQGGDRGRLILHNGQIYILRGDKTYTLTGQEVK